NSLCAISSFGRGFAAGLDDQPAAAFREIVKAFRRRVALLHGLVEKIVEALEAARLVLEDLWHRICGLVDVVEGDDCKCSERWAVDQVQFGFEHKCAGALGA